MEYLAQGIDPTSGNKIPADSVRNQESLLRCFRYVSGVLKNVIAQAAFSSARASTWDPLLASGALERFEYSAQPLPLRQFLKQLNSLRDAPSVRILRRAALYNWMSHEGFLTEQTASDDQKSYCPSDRGRAVGISSAVLNNKAGIPYTGIILSEAAQRFLVCSLDRIIAYHQSFWARRLALADPEKVPYSAQPVGMREFLRNLNGAFGWTSPNRVTVQDLSQWLSEEGFQYTKVSDKSKHMIPTEKGQNLGMSHLLMKNCYSIIQYNEAAQRYIVSHLFDIMSQ